MTDRELVAQLRAAADAIERKPTVDIRVYCNPKLKAAAIRLSQEEGVPLSEIVVRALAEYLDLPDLAEVPRKAPGRPCKPVVLNGKSI